MTTGNAVAMRASSMYVSCQGCMISEDWLPRRMARSPIEDSGQSESVGFNRCRRLRWESISPCACWRTVLECSTSALLCSTNDRCQLSAISVVADPVKGLSRATSKLLVFTLEPSQLLLDPPPLIEKPIHALLLLPCCFSLRKSPIVAGKRARTRRGVSLDKSARCGHHQHENPRPSNP